MKSIAVVVLIALINCVSAFRSLTSAIKSHRTSSFATAASAAQSTSNIGWDSHKAVDTIPESLVRSIDGNAGMRKKFEQVCREAQVG